MNDNLKYSDLTDKIILAFCTVYNRLGYGFLKKVYENAFLSEDLCEEHECQLVNYLKAAEIELGILFN
ncbi:MAG: hypothetical protein HXY50_06895 [Ignavibacteriaceae bacterium]|nr:hypothetical protein [Ignavibacteriaceae bacterium]